MLLISLDFFDKAKRQRFFDDLSDDDEYQNMTEEERNEKMTPQSMNSKLNLDGAVSLDDSSDDEAIVNSKKLAKNRKKAKIESDDEDVDEGIESPARDDSDDFDFDIPDFDQDQNHDQDANVENQITQHVDMQMTEAQMKNIKIPQSMPAQVYFFLLQI